MYEASPKEIAQCAIDHLRSGRGFSAIRLGDGEGRLLLWPDGISREMMNRHLTFWFGRDDFTDGTVSYMRWLLTTAIATADVCGCYKGTGRNAFWRAAKTQIPDHKWTCGNDLHRKLWEEGLLDEIIAAAEQVTLVTCRDVLQCFRRRYGKVATVLRIPEEGHTSGKPSHHWERHEDIIGNVFAATGPHRLVLVGAGFLGKKYTASASDAGAVGLDVGSLFDGWAGIGSRSYLTNHSLRYTMDASRGELSADSRPH